MNQTSDTEIIETFSVSPATARSMQPHLEQQVQSAMTMWDLCESGDHGTAEFSAVYLKYVTSVEALLSISGTKSPCRLIDVDLWGRYIEMFNFNHGMNPGEHTSYEDVRKYVTSRMH